MGDEQVVVKITRAVMTSSACPVQWDAWDAEGNYYYLRFRHGYGEMHQYENENWVGAPFPEGADVNFSNLHDINPMHIRTVTTFELEDEFGVDTLEQFAEHAGIELAPDLYETDYGEHLRDELIKEGMLFLLENGFPDMPKDADE
jgi:hypothetical protein